MENEPLPGPAPDRPPECGPVGASVVADGQSPPPCHESPVTGPHGGLSGCFRFDPAAVYSVEFLDRALRGITTARALCESLGVRHRLRSAVLGADILRAIAGAEPEPRRAVALPARTGKRGRPRKGVAPEHEPFSVSDLTRRA